jgi:rare lipoprotein A
MKSKLVITSFAAALSVGVVTALSSSQAGQDTAVSTSAQPNATQVTESAVKAEADETQSPDVAKVGEQQPQAEDPLEAVIARVEKHQRDGRNAATLYLRDTAVVTFLGTEPTIAETQGVKVATTDADASFDLQPAEDWRDPVLRAAMIAARINQLHQAGVKPDAIKVLWNQQRHSFMIQASEEHLLEMNPQTILPETTRDLAKDALKITNLLRQELGGASPLTQIEGRPQPQTVAVGPIRMQIRGEASWYGSYFHGRPTANGERYNQDALTAAHKTLPFGTKVRVTNLNNGRSVILRINDRGPFIPGRIIDLSRAGAQAIGMIGSGIAPVRVDVLN